MSKILPFYTGNELKQISKEDYELFKRFFTGEDVDIEEAGFKRAMKAALCDVLRQELLDNARKKKTQRR